jgi:membrane protein implicated in regulation of membrane protease activity
VELLLPRSARDWVAVAVVVALCVALGIAIGTAAAVAVLAALVALALLVLARVLRQGNRHRKEVRQAVADLTALRRELTDVHREMSLLRVTVAQAASAIAGSASETA